MLPRWQQRRLLLKSHELFEGRDSTEVGEEFSTSKIRQLARRFEPELLSDDDENSAHLPDHNPERLCEETTRKNKRSVRKNKTKGSTQQRTVSASVDGSATPAPSASPAPPPNRFLSKDEMVFFDRLSRASRQRSAGESAAIMRGEDVTDDVARGNRSSRSDLETVARFNAWNRNRTSARLRRISRRHPSVEKADAEKKDAEKETAKPKPKPKPKPRRRVFPRRKMVPCDDEGESEDSDFLEALSRINKKSYAEFLKTLRRQKAEREKKRMEKQMKDLNLQDGQQVSREQMLRSVQGPSGDELKQRVEAEMIRSVQRAERARYAKATARRRRSSNASSIP